MTIPEEIKIPENPFLTIKFDNKHYNCQFTGYNCQPKDYDIEFKDSNSKNKFEIPLIKSLWDLQSFPFFTEQEININEILSNGHTARLPLVYVLRDCLNKIQKQKWRVQIDEMSLLLFKNHEEPKLTGYFEFHAVKYKEYLKELKENIDKCIKECGDYWPIPQGCVVAVVGNFEKKREVNFYACLSSIVPYHN